MTPTPSTGDGLNPRTGHAWLCECAYCCDLDGAKAEANRIAQASTGDGLIERLRDEAEALSRAAWSRPDGGQDACIASNLATEAADTIQTLQTERERLFKDAFIMGWNHHERSEDPREAIKGAERDWQHYAALAALNSNPNTSGEA